MRATCPGSEIEPVEIFEDGSGRCGSCQRTWNLRNDGTLRKHVPVSRSQFPACKDCREQGVTRIRPAPWPGPRCATHWRAEVARRKLAAHARRTENNFGLTSEQYWGLYEYQGGLCWICKKANGKARRLAVDHDHFKGCNHPPDKGCLVCVRALLCGPCNERLGAWGIAELQRALEVLGEDPPAQRFLRASNAS